MPLSALVRSLSGPCHAFAKPLSGLCQAFDQPPKTHPTKTDQPKPTPSRQNNKKKTDKFPFKLSYAKTTQHLDGGLGKTKTNKTTTTTSLCPRQNPQGARARNIVRSGASPPHSDVSKPCHTDVSKFDRNEKVARHELYVLVVTKNVCGSVCQNPPRPLASWRVELKSTCLAYLLSKEKIKKIPLPSPSPPGPAGPLQ